MTAIVKRLLILTESTLGLAMKTPKDFQLLADRIYQRLHQHISPTTLKRVWGYQMDQGPARSTTYTILAQFCGYANWDSFVENEKKGESQSAIILNRHLKTEDLQKGTRIQLFWAPNRICEIEYLGDRKYTVLRAQNAKLRAGNTFMCDVFIEQEPLYVYNLTQSRKQTGLCYCAGRTDGIRFEVIPKEE